MATALTIGNLANYVEENAFELLSKAVLETNLAQYITIRAGLQGTSVDIPLMEDDLTLSYNSVTSDWCGWADNGTTTLSQVNMKMFRPRIQRAYCVNTLRDTFMSQQLSAGAYNGEESLPFEQVAANYFTKGVTNINENYLIKGSTVGGTFKGLKTQAADAVTAGTIIAGQALNQGTWVASESPSTGQINALQAAMDVFTAAPAEIMMRDDNILIVSHAAYKALVGAMVTANLYNFVGDERELFIPSTNVRVVPSAGIPTSDNFKLLTSGSNIIMGTDLTSDFDEFKVWYSQDNDEVRASMKWAVGVKIVEPALCVAVDEQ